MKGEKLGSNDYKPISLLSNISKLYEKAIHIGLTNFYRKNTGFRNSHSSNPALIRLTEIIRNAPGNGNFACRVFIEL